jgi:hypothetical protein
MVNSKLVLLKRRVSKVAPNIPVALGGIADRHDHAAFSGAAVGAVYGNGRLIARLHILPV